MTTVWQREEDAPTFGNFIGGRWQAAQNGEVFPAKNPGRVHEVIGWFAQSQEEDVQQALAAADAAQKSWRHSPPAQRAAILDKAAQWLLNRQESIAQEIMREEGKILREARMEVQRTAEHLKFYAAAGYLTTGETFPSGDPHQWLFSQRYPLGVVAVITPWNFPLSIPGRKIAPALAAGNTVIFKPASETPLSAVRLVQALEAAGLPDGVCNLLTGRGAVVGKSLVSARNVAAVTFTGSTAVGFQIHQDVSPQCRLQLELGGKNALVVWDDADVPLAVSLAVQGGYNLAGQACTGTS
ncbi:MAG: aldehyde dehydrogenase family protein, partial [Firmicutes bacterium]|nr:aldehyde dehydrogenase family protein [Bacillota bacterium]